MRALCTALLLAPLTAACGGSSSADSAHGDGKPPRGFPYTVTNCGVKTTFERPPEHVVTMNQHVTEIMLALGLQDRVVGTAYLDDRILPKYAKQYGEVEVLAKKYPSKETLLAADPDLVYGGYDSAFDKSEGRERSALKESGVDSRLNLEGCTKDVDAGTLRKEIREVGCTFGVPGRAEALIEKQDAQLWRRRRSGSRACTSHPSSSTTAATGRRSPRAAKASATTSCGGPAGVTSSPMCTGPSLTSPGRRSSRADRRQLAFLLRREGHHQPAWPGYRSHGAAR